MRGLIGVTAAALLLTALAAPPASSRDSGTDRPSVTAPNVLLINLDDATELMLDWTKPDGMPVMPMIQDFKQTSTVFDNTFVDIPSCCPSRFSTFTGRYPHNTGGKVQDDGTKLPVKKTFAYQLQQAGYATAMAGKFLIPWPIGDAPPSYDRFSFIKGGYYRPQINRNGDLDTVPGYSTTLLAKDLGGYLSEFDASNDSQPWYGYWAPQTPHTAGGYKGLAVPEHKYADVDMGTCAQPIEQDRSDKPPYVRFVAPDPAYDQKLCTSQLQALISVDKRFGQLIQQLKTLGEYDNTMIVVTSDNGYHWGEQGWFSKFYQYDPSVGIPLYVKWPAGVGGPPSVDSRLASSLDVTSTIYALTGIAPPAVLDGDSLLEPDTRTEIYSEYFQDPANGDMGSWAMLRGTDWKYVESTQRSKNGTVTKFTEYYDLAADPGELTNVLDDGVVGNEPPADVLAALAARLKAARSCAGASCP